MRKPLSRNHVKPPAGLRADAVAFLRHDGARFRINLADGTPSNAFAQDEDRDAVRAILARNGFTLHDDNSITKDA